MSFDPNQPRDDHGRWSETSGGGGSDDRATKIENSGFREGASPESLIVKEGDKIGGVFPVSPESAREYEHLVTTEKTKRSAGIMIQSPEMYRESLKELRRSNWQDTKDQDLSHSSRGYVEAKRELLSRFSSVDEYNHALEKTLKTRMDNSDPASLMSSATLGKLLDGDHLQNVFETSKSSAPGNRSGAKFDYVAERAKHDANAFGIPMTAPGHERPVYGLAHDHDSSAHAGTLLGDYKAYGSALIVFDDRIREHTTFTAVDSLDGRQVVAPSPMIAPKSYSAPATTDSKTLVDELNRTHVSDTHQYHELQFHVRPSGKHIRMVYFSKEPSASLVKKLSKAGVKWTVAPLVETK